MDMSMRKDDLTVRYKTARGEDVITVHDIIQLVKDKGNLGVDLILFSLPMFDIWLDILLNDDLHSYLKIRSGLPMDHRRLLVNSMFQYEPYRLDDVSCSYRSSFILSAASGSLEIARQMIADGVDVMLTDPAMGDNMVHALIEAARAETTKEDDMVYNYCTLVSKLSVKLRVKLLTMPNRDGYRPLELASRYGLFKLASSILDTRGVYMTVIGRRGLNTFVQYHLREYGNDCPTDRYLRSPLRYLTHATTDMLPSLKGSNILQSPLLRTWIQRKFELCLPWIIMWYLYRLFLVSLVLVFDPTKGADPTMNNSSHGSTHHRSNLFTQETYNDILILIVALSCVSIVLDVLFFLVKYSDSLFRKVHGMNFVQFRDYIAFTRFYQLIQLSFSIFCIAGYLTGGVLFRSDIALVFKCLLLPTTIFTLMEPMELLPALGPFVIFLQKMVPTLQKFVIITILLNLTFGLFFHDATYSDPDSKFTSPTQSHYSAILLQQSAVIFGQDPSLAVQYAHMFFYLLSTILLVLYTTAIMVRDVSSLNDSKWEIYTLRRLQVILFIEERFFRWISVFIKKYLHSKLPSWLDIRHDIVVVKNKLSTENTHVIW